MWFLPKKKPPCVLYIHRRTVETVPPHVQNHLTGLPLPPPPVYIQKGMGIHTPTPVNYINRAKVTYPPPLSPIKPTQ